MYAGKVSHIKAFQLSVFNAVAWIWPIFTISSSPVAAIDGAQAGECSCDFGKSKNGYYALQLPFSVEREYALFKECQSKV